MTPARLCLKCWSHFCWTDWSRAVMAATASCSRAITGSQVIVGYEKNREMLQPEIDKLVRLFHLRQSPVSNGRVWMNREGTSVIFHSKSGRVFFDCCVKED